MTVTKGGIFLNIKESEYTISNDEIVFFFSSMFYLNKFLDKYKENRIIFNSKFKKIIEADILNSDLLADIMFYRKIEKRGFFVKLKGEPVSCESLYQFGLEKATKKNIGDWSKTQNQK